VEEAGITSGNPFFILRFVSGKAYHDTREEWMTIDQKLKIINLVKDYGEVFITTERKSSLN
jgi:predicted glycosyltransferase